MNQSKSPKTEKIATALIGFGGGFISLGLITACVIIVMLVTVPDYQGLDSQSNFFAIWLILTFVFGPYLAITGFYFRLLHHKIPTFLKPVGLVLPILFFLALMQGFLNPDVNKFFKFFDEELYKNIILELLGGLFTAWIFYFGFELYREEEQEREYKQLLSELKSIRKELELLKQQTQQQIVVQSPAPNFITRLIQWFQKG